LPQRPSPAANITTGMDTSSGTLWLCPAVVLEYDLAIVFDDYGAANHD
jgi:hypothetical protein